MFSVCVCFGDPCAQNFLDWETILRDFFVLIGSLVELYVWLHSYLCFSPLEKLFWKSWLDTSSIPCYLSSFSNLFLNAISTPPRYLVDRSTKLLPSWYLLDTWWINRASVLEFDSLLLDTCSIPQLSTTSFSTPTSTASLTPPDTSAVEHYWRVYIYFHRNPFLISLISLDLSASVHLPNTLSFTPNLFIWDFFWLFQVFLHLVSF